MNKNIKNILREKITIINIHIKNTKLKILKSIKQNNNTTNKTKIYTNYLINKLKTKNTLVSQTHKICFYTGKRSGVLKGFNFSRYRIKNLILENKFTNIKKNNF